MAAEGGDHITWFTYTGEEGEVIPDDATSLWMSKSFRQMHSISAFFEHEHIIEVICQDRVETIEFDAFFCCPRLRRVIMRGVKTVEDRAFHGCDALTDIDKLEIIEEWAFCDCSSLRSMNLPSVEIVEERAFAGCRVLAEAKFGKKLERFDQKAFRNYCSLERITIPLKDGMITTDDIFLACKNLKNVDLVEGALLHEIIAALHFEDWREDMSAEIDLINQILPNADAGGEWDYDIRGYNFGGEKARVIRGWITSVLGKIIHYKTAHQRVLDVAATTLQLALPRDIVMNNFLSFLELPPHRFGVEGREDEVDVNQEEAKEEEQRD